MIIKLHDPDFPFLYIKYYYRKIFLSEELKPDTNLKWPFVTSSQRDDKCTRITFRFPIAKPEEYFYLIQVSRNGNDIISLAPLFEIHDEYTYIENYTGFPGSYYICEPLGNDWYIIDLYAPT